MSHYSVKSTWIYLALRTWLFLFLTTTHPWALGSPSPAVPGLWVLTGFNCLDQPHLGWGPTHTLCPWAQELHLSLALSSYSWFEPLWVSALCCVSALVGGWFCVAGRWFPVLSLVPAWAPWMALSNMDMLVPFLGVFSSAQGLAMHRGVFEPLECIRRLYTIKHKDFFLFFLFKWGHGRVEWYSHVSKGWGDNCSSAGVLSW